MELIREKMQKEFNSLQEYYKRLRTVCDESINFDNIDDENKGSIETLFCLFDDIDFTLSQKNVDFDRLEELDGLIELSMDSLGIKKAPNKDA